MGIRISWADEARTIIRYDFEGRWNWDEYELALKQVMAMSASVNHRVDVIINVEKNETIPPGALTHIRQGTLSASENWGIGVVVGASPLVRTIFSAFSRAYRRMGERYKMAESIEEAFAIIAEERAKGSSVD